MGLIIGMLIEVIAIGSLLYFTRKIKNVYFRTFGVAVFAFIVANAIFWLPVWLGLLNNKIVSSSHTFILFLTTFGIAIGGLVFWFTEAKKNILKNRN